MAQSQIEAFSVRSFLPSRCAYPCYEHEFLVVPTNQGWVIADPAARQFFSAIGMLGSDSKVAPIMIVGKIDLESMITSVMARRDRITHPLIIEENWNDPSKRAIVAERGLEFGNYLRRIWIRDGFDSPRPLEHSYVTLLRNRSTNLSPVAAWIRQSILEDAVTEKWGWSGPLQMPTP